VAEKFRNKYRSDSARLRGYDYGRPGSYFVTICAKNRFHYFGKIMNGEMFYSKTGIIASKHLLEIPDHIPGTLLDAYTIMPNHIHCVITITDDGSAKPVGTFHETSLRVQNQPSKNKSMADISPKPGSLPTIVRSYKSSVTKWCNENQILFAWQTRFHDHIIRNETEYQRIRNYIINNPMRWKYDKENK
jgi:REP element-mobilizing transposase RayT